MPLDRVAVATSSLLGLMLGSASVAAGHLAGGLPSPSCMLNGNASLDNSTTPLPHPCPLPVGWDVDWSVVNSTALMSTNPTGFHPVNHTWGWVTLDWQANRHFWLHDDPQRTTCEASSAQNCAQLKREGKVRRCTIYHNMELALEWLESNRKVMDAAHVEKGWFLRYPNGTVYDQRRQPPAGAKGQPMPWLSQWFIDWRNAEAAAYFVGAIVNSTFLPGVDGTFTDDSQGVPREHPTLAGQLGVTNASLAPLEFATQQAGNFLAVALAAAGKTCFDCVGGQVSWTGTSGALSGEGRGFGYNQRPPPTPVEQCTAWMRNYCAPEMQGRGMFLEWDVNNATRHAQTMAAFLVTRPPVAAPLNCISFLSTDLCWSFVWRSHSALPLSKAIVSRRRRWHFLEAIVCVGPGKTAQRTAKPSVHSFY